MESYFIRGSRFDLENLDLAFFAILSVIGITFVTYLLVFVFNTFSTVKGSRGSKSNHHLKRDDVCLPSTPSDHDQDESDDHPEHRRSTLVPSNQTPYDASRDRDGLDVIVVGAGVAGSALAYTLGKEGRRVLLLERDLNQPDRIVGELLQPGGYLKLKDLGMEDCVEGIDAQRVYGYALFKDGREARVGYPLDPKMYGKDVAGRSFHHGRFIQKLREKAASSDRVTVKQALVTALVEDDDGTVRGVKFRSENGAAGEEQEEALAPLTVICDGCFSRFRRQLSFGKVDSTSYFVGLILENCPLPCPNYGHVVLANPSPILFYPVSSTEVRCLVDVPGAKLPSIQSGEMAQYLRTQIYPQLPTLLAAPFLAAIKEGNIRSMPNKTLPAAPILRPGVLLMGDAFNMRHPLTGGGMTVALSDIALLRDMMRPLPHFDDVAAIGDYMQAFYTRRKPMAATINTLAGALYKVFCVSNDSAMSEMRQACFDYLSLGGVFSAGPIALLSGLNPRPISLVIHFFAVALYGVGRLCLPIPSIKRLNIGVRLIKGASNIIVPIIRAEGVRQMFFPTTLPAYYRDPPSS